MNFELIVGITTALITITGGFFPIVAYGQLIYTPVPRQSPVQSQTSCSTGWYITGYFTPKESDYSGSKQTVFVHGIGKKSFYSSFLNDVRTEGAGLTRFGWYLANYGSGWLKIPFPQDAQGNQLKAGESVATDPNVIPTGTSGITIPTLPSPWNNKIFIANDLGSDFKGKKLSIYLGEGKLAEHGILQISGSNNKLCFQNMH